MASELEQHPDYQRTIMALEDKRQVSDFGKEFWMARDIHAILGYPVWDKFLPVVERARDSLRSLGKEPSHHIAHTSKMVGIGSGAQRRVDDFFLNRGACRLIAMNGDPTKPEIAGAQAYFVVQTHRMEQQDALADDEKRLEVREKAKASFKTVSGVAQNAGIAGPRQGGHGRHRLFYQSRLGEDVGASDYDL